MAVLLTGATGHVGANLLRHLLAERAAGAGGQGSEGRLRVLLRPTSNRAPVHGLDVDVVEGDLRDPIAMRSAVAGCERVYHCAARVQTVQGRERELFETNVIGTRNLLAAAREAGVRRVVVTGSLGAVGHAKERPCDENDPFDPFTHHLPYEESKAWVEHECLRATCAGLPVVVAVSTAVLGPNDYVPSRMGRVIMDFANGDLRAYIPGGFEFVAASDLAAGHVLCMEKGRPGQRYIFSTRFLTIDDLMQILEGVTGRKRPRRLSPGAMMAFAHVSTFVLNRLAPERPQRFTPDAVRLLQLQRRASTAKAQTDLGFAPGSIEKAVAEAYAWFVAHGRIALRGNTPRTGPSAANDVVPGDVPIAQKELS